MARESQTERYRSPIASIAEYGHTSEDTSRLRWSDLNIPDAPSVPRHKPTVYPEILGRAFENTSEYALHKSQKRTSVKFNLAPMPQSFNSPVVFRVLINKVGPSSQSLVAAVDMLVSIVGENEHQPITSLTSDDHQRLTKARDRLSAIVGEDENHPFTPLIDFISNLIKIHDKKPNPSTQTDLLAQETNDPEHTDAATLKPHRPEKVGRPTTPSLMKLTDLLSQETNDPEHTDAATLKPHRPEKVGRPTTLPRLKLADLLSQETDDSASGEIDTGPSVGNEV